MALGSEVRDMDFAVPLEFAGSPTGGGALIPADFSARGNQPAIEAGASTACASA